MATVNLFESDPMSEILANTPVDQAIRDADYARDADARRDADALRDADIPPATNPGNVSQGTFDGIVSADRINELLRTGQLTNAQAIELAEAKGIFVPGLSDDPTVNGAGRTSAAQSDFGQPDVSSFSPTTVSPDIFNNAATVEDIERLLANGDITNSQAVEIANAKRIFVPGLEEYLKFDDPQQGVADRGFEAIEIADKFDDQLDEKTRLETEQAQRELAEDEQEKAKAEAEAEALAAEDDAQEAEELQEDLVDLFTMDAAANGYDYDYGFEFAGFDDFDSYLEDELEDFDYFDEEWAEMEMQYGMDIDGDGVIGSIDGVDFFTEDMSVEGAEVEGAAVEGDEIGDPELEKSALTGPELDGPQMGEEGAEEGLDAEGKAKGQGVDGEDAGEMQVGELQAEGSERDGAGLDAGEMDVVPLEELEADEPEMQAPEVSAAAAQVDVTQAVNEKTALDTMMRMSAADSGAVVDAATDELKAAQSIDVATGSQVAVGTPVANAVAPTIDQTPAPEAPAAATPEPEAPAKTEPAAAKSLGIPVKFGEMEPWVKELSNKFQGMVDPSQFVNLAATNISPTGKVPQEHGTGMAYNPTLPNLGGGQQLAV